MKKVLSMMLVLILAVALMAVAVSAAAPTITVTNAEGATGDTITVDVKINDNPGFVSGKVKLAWDKAALELVSFESVKLNGAVNVQDGVANHYQGEVTGDGVLCKATFKILAAGDHTVTATVSGMRNAAGDVLINGDSFNGVVEVECDHAWGEWVVDKEATCTEKGSKSRTCALCGETDTEVIDTLGHSWGKWEVTKKATCKEEGEKTRTCAVCGETETKETKKAEHKYKNGKCQVCGKKDPNYGKKDPIPGTGDITPVVTMGVVAMISVVAAAAYVTKRRITK